MSLQQRIGGTVYLKVNGVQMRVKPGPTYNLGLPTREAVVGADGVHGYMEKQQTPYIACKISDGPDVDLEALVQGRGETVTLELINGKTVVLREAWWAGAGEVNAETGEIDARWEGLTAAEVSA